MTYDEAKTYIVEKLPRSEILLQLSEEAAELSAAASKLLRIENGINPSSVSHEDAEYAVVEEFGDVLNCILALFRGNEFAKVKNIRHKKMVRWAYRIEGSEVK